MIRAVKSFLNLFSSTTLWKVLYNNKKKSFSSSQTNELQFIIIKVYWKICTSLNIESIVEFIKELENHENSHHQKKCM